MPDGSMYSGDFNKGLK